LPKAWACFVKVKEGAPSVCNDLNIKDTNGRGIPSEFIASPIFVGKKVTQAHVVFRNMSQRKEMERLIRESEKIKAFKHFVAGMTREIQRPLKSLLYRSHNLIKKYKDSYFEYIGYKEFSDIMKTLRTMDAQMEYCYDTANKIVNLSRRKARLEDRQCAVKTVVQETVNLLKHSGEVSGINVALKLSSQLPRVAIGPIDLGQVINNVLANAIQSLPSGGNIQIKATYQKALDAVRIDCQDDGIGIPGEVLDRVFEPFFTTRPSHGPEKSSGLGLSIVYSIIKDHQGEVIIKSDVHKGTLVTILLPVYRPHKQSKRK
jgi:signal transduction histidine kinase